MGIRDAQELAGQVLLIHGHMERIKCIHLPHMYM